MTPPASSAAERKRRAEEMLEAVGLGPEFHNRKPAQLSGGQRQRVWIAMALAQKTGILLLDEPTTYLDIAHQLEILELLKKLNAKEHTTIVLVIHELNQAAKFADHIFGLKQGRLLCSGSAREVIREEQLLQLYDIHAEIVHKDVYGYPICMDYTLRRNSELQDL